MMNANKEQEFLKRLRTVFRTEAEERLHSLSTGLVELENTVDEKKNTVIIEGLFRETHSMKGAARSVNLKDIESICQQMESVFLGIKQSEITLSQELFGLLLNSTDCITELVSNIDNVDIQPDKTLISNLCEQLKKAANGHILPLKQTANDMTFEKDAVLKATISPEPVEPPTKSKKKLSDKENIITESSKKTKEVMTKETVRIPISKLEPLLFQAEELIQLKTSANIRVIEANNILNELVLFKGELGSINEKIDSIANKIPEWTILQLNNLILNTSSFRGKLIKDHRDLQLIVDEHLKAMKQLLMLPVSTIVDILPRLVRDLSYDQDKEIELVINGSELEIDKRILDELKDPLIHLIRNCVDHGIKTPKERLEQNKPKSGKIIISFNAKDSQHLEIIVSDDGIGIDTDKLRASAAKAGILSEQMIETMDTDEISQLIFRSGISTSRVITDVSGRGLGLAIVKEKIENLKGAVSFESKINVGTTFKIELPMSLSTFNGILVRVQEYCYILPLSNIEYVSQILQEDIKTIESKETILFRDEILSLVKLSVIVGLAEKKIDTVNRNVKADGTANYLPVVIIRSLNKRIAVLIDEVLGVEEILVKSLGKQLKQVHNFSGSTILGSGNVVPILNCAELIESSLNPAIVSMLPSMSSKTQSVAKRILVADDSITARMMIKNILESSGYDIATAVDGMDAFIQLRSNDYDLLVSDVDMPRMSGFELTEKIRSDKKLADLPVILVTALESKQDWEHGIEVGANAYILKSSFDQSNLLEIMSRLL